MGRAEHVLDLGVVLGPLVDVFDIETDGRSRGPALEHAGYDLHLIRFPALGRVARLAGPTALQIGLQVVLAQSHSRRTAVNDAANSSAMTFTEGSHREQLTERISAHGRGL